MPNPVPISPLASSDVPTPCSSKTAADSRVPALRREALNSAEIRNGGRHVVYWMTAYRRPAWNFALDRAVELAAAHSVPLIVLEALRCDYRWASDRLHAFVLAGMRDQRKAFAKSPVGYHAYVEPEEGAGRGLLAALAKDACAVITDAFPSFFVPRMQAVAAKQLARLKIPLERVDSAGLFPMAATDRIFPSAHTFRRQLQKDLAPHLGDFPDKAPLRRAAHLPPAELPAKVVERWDQAPDELLGGDRSALAKLPIDHGVSVSGVLPGGFQAARRRLAKFLEHGLPRYHQDRNQPDSDVASGLSPYLHFGHISSHEIFAALARDRGWNRSRISKRVTGSREGWWGLDPAAEGFLDQLVTWRELGFNMTSKRDDYDQFESLPNFARTTLDEHRKDPRPFLYSFSEFDQARTHDELWNAAQRELVATGRMHNYLRMLWGKKILEWTPDPETALKVMIELNNRYALDGRNPSSYSGIFWCLGRYDRAWGPEREVFGKIRFMSSDSTRRKLRLAGYLGRYGEAGLFG